jgi:hypothetical protein
MNEISRRVLGVALIIAAAATVAIGYANAPSASTCRTDNNLSRALGQGMTCSTSPSVSYFVAAAILVVAGLLVIVPWWRRLVEP